MAERTYHVGMRGSKVAQIQARLKVLGIYSGAIDEVYGPDTKKAVEAFQRSKQLAADGVVGYETSQILFATQFDNYAKRIGSRGKYEWFKWRIFVKEPLEKFKRIRSVEYRLHETFPNPIRIADDPATRFMIESSGWGEFWIFITVYLDDEYEETTKHYLNLGIPWPAEED